MRGEIPRISFPYQCAQRLLLPNRGAAPITTAERVAPEREPERTCLQEIEAAATAMVRTEPVRTHVPMLRLVGTAPPPGWSWTAPHRASNHHHPLGPCGCSLDRLVMDYTPGHVLPRVKHLASHILLSRWQRVFSKSRTVLSPTASDSFGDHQWA